MSEKIKVTKPWVLSILIGNHTYYLDFNCKDDLMEKVAEVAYPVEPSEWIKVDNNYFRVSDIQGMTYWEIKCS